jgi:hypothetical protein
MWPPKKYPGPEDGGSGKAWPTASPADTMRMLRVSRATAARVSAPAAVKAGSSCRRGGYRAQVVPLSVVDVLDPLRDGHAGAAGPHARDGELLGVPGEVVCGGDHDLIARLPVLRAVQREGGVARLQGLVQPDPARAGIRRVDRGVGRALLAEELHRAAVRDGQDLVAEVALCCATVVVEQGLVLVQAVGDPRAGKPCCPVGVPDVPADAALRIGQADDALPAVAVTGSRWLLRPVEVDGDHAALGADGGGGRARDQAAAILHEDRPGPEVDGGVGEDQASARDDVDVPELIGTGPTWQGTLTSRSVPGWPGGASVPPVQLAASAAPIGPATIAKVARAATAIATVVLIMASSRGLERVGHTTFRAFVHKRTRPSRHGSVVQAAPGPKGHMNFKDGSGRPAAHDPRADGTSRWPGVERWREWVHHSLRPHPFVELLRRQETKPQRGLAQAQVFLVRLEGNLRRLLVADVRIERGHQHERVVQVLPDALGVRLDACGAAIVERAGSLSQECGVLFCSRRRPLLKIADALDEPRRAPWFC